MLPTRRELLRLGMMGAVVSARASRVEAHAERPSPCGLVIHSFAVHTARDRSLPPSERFAEPFRFLAHARGLGARGVQVGLGVLEPSRAEALGRQAEADGMYLEGIAALPRDESDLERFRAELNTARLAGASIVRTVMLSGRRYETFGSLAEFRRFADQSTHSLGLAAREAARLGVHLAVENHKDWRAGELIAILKKYGNDHVGVCLDTGNSMALLEDPMEVVEALSPFAITTHFKDMAVEECRDGFLLAEVPLGNGLLDLPRVVSTLRRHRPEIRFNLEMITRDPLLVPCLTPRYWETFPALPARDLSRSLRLARDHTPGRPLPRISKLTVADQTRAEDDNITRCLAHARDQLGLAPA